MSLLLSRDLAGLSDLPLSEFSSFQLQVDCSETIYLSLRSLALFLGNKTKQNRAAAHVLLCPREKVVGILYNHLLLSNSLVSHSLYRATDFITGTLPMASFEVVVLSLNAK